ncbi:hypothetical protein F66182_8619 [Fusarium sp. NRRL 66182]|nr:hypothetical protein F66182_8619 [Fusarium sp. NRRL 66182]
MSIESRLETLPLELHLHIFSSLTPPDLARLARTCKCLCEAAEPLIWTDIELHEIGYHESKAELNVPPPMRPPESRPYHPRQNWGCGQGASLFCMLQTLHKQDPERLQQLTRRVKHLCTVMVPRWRLTEGGDENSEPSLDPQGIPVWHLLPYFSNLETLELHGDSLYSEKNGEHVPEMTGPTPRLRYAKLSGYIPRAVPAWVLKARETLQHLELGMLDRPISTCLSSNPDFKPLPEEKLSTDEDGGSDYGSLCEDAVIPRPLGGFLPSHGSASLVLPKLKRLHLCQPAPSSYYDSVLDYGWSTRAEAACYADWRQILQASISTLETLVLEHRPAAEYIEGDGMGEIEWMEGNVSSDAGASLIDMVQEIIASGREPGALRSVYMYGIAAGEEDDGTPYLEIPAGRFMQFLQGCGITCEARLGRWCYFDSSPGTVSWSNWAADDEEEEEDEDDEDEDHEPKMAWDSILSKV